MRSRSRPIDAHAVLGIKPGASRGEIRRAYRRLALQTHPDVAGAGATEDMARLNEAHDQLASRAPSSTGGTAETPATGATPRAPREPRQGPVSAEHGAAWTDHWSAWNDLPHRD